MVTETSEESVPPQDHIELLTEDGEPEETLSGFEMILEEEESSEQESVNDEDKADSEIPLEELCLEDKEE